MAQLAHGGRPENPITWDGPVADLARALRHVREQAGQPSYRALAQSTHYSASVLAAAADGRYCPTWDVASAFITACGASAADLRPLWDKAIATAQKSRSMDRRQRERTRAAASSIRPRSQDNVRDLVPGEPSPRRASTPAQYVHQLRALRAWAGQPGYKTILQRNAAMPRDIPRSTMYDALNPARTRLPALEVVQAIVRACASPGAAEAWTTAWKALRLREFEQDDPPAAEDSPAVVGPAAAVRQPLRVVQDRLPARHHGSRTSALPGVGSYSARGG